MSALKSVLEHSSSSKDDQDEAPVWKKILLIILSVLFLAASIIFVSPSVPGLLYASIVALVLFVLMYLHNRNRPMNKILHKPRARALDDNNFLRPVFSLRAMDNCRTGNVTTLDFCLLVGPRFQVRFQCK